MGKKRCFPPVSRLSLVGNNLPLARRSPIACVHRPCDGYIWAIHPSVLCRVLCTVSTVRAQPRSAQRRLHAALYCAIVLPLLTDFVCTVTSNDDSTHSLSNSQVTHSTPDNIPSSQHLLRMIDQALRTPLLETTLHMESV